MVLTHSHMGQTVRLSDCQLKGPVSCAFPARIFSVSGCQDPMGTGTDVVNLPGLVHLQKANWNMAQSKSWIYPAK